MEFFKFLKRGRDPHEDTSSTKPAKRPRCDDQDAYPSCSLNPRFPTPQPAAQSIPGAWPTEIPAEHISLKIVPDPGPNTQECPLIATPRAIAAMAMVAEAPDLSQHVPLPCTSTHPRPLLPTTPASNISIRPKLQPPTPPSSNTHFKPKDQLPSPPLSYMSTPQFTNPQCLAGGVSTSPLILPIHDVPMSEAPGYSLLGSPETPAGSGSAPPSSTSLSTPVSNAQPPSYSASAHSQSRIVEAFGLKVLIEGVDPIVDIVAVHGLDGHREETWTSGNGNLWLRDWLPRLIPGARILTYGYDARTHGSTPLSCQSLHDHALDLVGELSLRRKSTKTEKRPIIFIAHCTGGNIVKDALIHSNSANQSNLLAHKAIKTSTTGVMFFGTPHQGTDNISWAEIINAASRTKKNEPILQDLEEGSRALQKQLTQYNHISTDFETKFFYETYAPVSGAEPIVPYASAVVPGTTNVETYAINSNHENLVKYQSPEDAGYSKVSLCLTLMVEEAAKKATHNWDRQGMIVAAHNDGGVRMTFEIPFELEHLRNSRFTGRKLLLDTLDAEVKANACARSRPIVLHGTGGVGKTQIVTEYIYLHREEYDSVFWINTSSPETILQGFRAAAQRVIRQHANITLGANPDYALVAKSLGMVGVVDENGTLSIDEKYNQAIIDGMKLWFSKEGNKKWLLVFDNADDLETFKIKTFIPQKDHGTIIITSRRPGCADLGKGLEVKEMLELEGLSLLLATAGLEQLHDDPTALELSKKLGYLPLALVQAGAYIAARGMPLDEYLEIYDKYFKRVFSEIPSAAIWDYGPRSVVTTWEISYEAIKESSKDAAELLSLCALLSNEIRKDMLCRGKGKRETDIDIGDSMKLLFSYSLAQRQKTNGSFYIHPVVHQWARERLEEDVRAQKVQEAVILVSTAVFCPDQKTIEHWRYESSVMPHIRTVTTNVEKYLPGDLMGDGIHNPMCRLAAIYSEWGQLKEAAAIEKRLADMAWKRLGDDDPNTLAAIANLAATYTKAGQTSEAEEMTLQVVKGFQRTLGEEHQNTLTSTLNLASIYDKQGRLSEAETLKRQVVAAMQRTLGEEHPDTVNAMSNLAGTWIQLGKLDEATKIGRQVLKARQRILGNEHPDTLSAMSHLATTYSELGRWEEAKKLEEQVLEGQRKMLGDEHPDTLSAIGNLATTYSKLGRWKEAEKLEVQVLEGRRNTLGKEHPDTLSAMNNLAASYSRQGQWKEAAEMAAMVVEAMRRTQGDEHPNTMSAMGNLAASYSKLGRWKEAEKLEVQVLEGRRNTLGEEHLGTLSAMGNLAATYSKLGRWKEAEKLEVQVLKGRRNTLGEEHPNTLSAMNNLAASYYKLGRCEEGEGMMKHVVEVMSRTQGDEHPDTLSVMHSLAARYCDDGRLDEAEKMKKHILQVRRTTIGEDHPDTLSAMNNLAVTYGRQDQLEEAAKLRLELVQARKRANGEDHPDTFLAITQLATIYAQQDRTSKALGILQKAVNSMNRTLGEDHPQTRSSMELLSLLVRKSELCTMMDPESDALVALEMEDKDHPDTLQAMASIAERCRRGGRIQDAELILLEVMKGREKILGDDHLDTLSTIANLATIYWTQERWEDAEELGKQVVETSRKLLGSEHRDTLLAIVHLASTYWNQGRWEEAEELELQVVSLRQATLGDDHPDTLSAMSSLAVSYRMQGQYQQAEELHRRVMEASERRNGSEHPETMSAMSNLASTYTSQDRWDEAEPLRRVVMDVRQQQLGTNHPDTRTAISSLALTCRKIGRPEPVRPCRQVTSSQSIASNDHPDTMEEMRDLMTSYVEQGRSEDLQQLAIATAERLGNAHPVTMYIKSVVSAILRRLGRHNEASGLRDQVIDTMQRLGADPATLVDFAGHM